MTFQEIADALEKSPLSFIAVGAIVAAIYCFRAWQSEAKARLDDNKAHARELLETTRLMGQATENLRISAEVMKRATGVRDV